MRIHALGGGEWLGAAYLTLVLGALIGGLAGANEWHEIVVAFVGAGALSVVLERLAAAVAWPRRRAEGGKQHDG